MLAFCFFSRTERVEALPPGGTPSGTRRLNISWYILMVN